MGKTVVYREISENPSNSDSLNRRFGFVFFITLVLKLIAGSFLPLALDEKYYWVWSHHLQLSYFDHPPFVAWLLKLGQPLENFASAVRIPGIVFGHLQILFWFLLLKPWLNLQRLNWLLALLILNPLSGMGGLILTPDLPMMTFWPLSMWLFLRYLKTLRLLDALLFGFAIGLGFLSKYQIIILPIAIVGWMTLQRKWAQTRLLHVGAALIAGIIAASPVFIWNMQNNFDSFLFQARHGLGSESYDPLWTLSYLGSVILLVFPTVLWASLQRSPETRNSWLPWLAWTPLIFFGLATFRGRPEANWPIAGYPAIFSLAVIHARSLKSLKIACVTWITLYVVATSAIIYPWMPLLNEQTKLAEFSEHEKLMTVVNTKQPLYLASYQLASAISWETKKMHYKVRGIGRRDFFDYLEGSLPSQQRFWLVTGFWDKLPEDLMKTHDYKRIEVIDKSYFVWEFWKK